MINKIAFLRKFSFSGPPQKEFELIIKHKGEIIYQNEGYGGAFSFVESIKELTKFDIEANSQRLLFGHQLVVLNAFEMLYKDFGGYMKDVVEILKKRGDLRHE